MSRKTKHFIEFESFKRISGPEELIKIQNELEDPYCLTGMDRLRAFYEMMGLPFDEEGFEKIIKKYSSL
ncbi:hypothetical protein [Methanobrevibacter sp.]|uniref:hypothetical protein n=1 Tax=Methanobrevibacter sp. TaxID=66852 RepID=UPI0025F91278|nr:hypothetical protein [Methanobrevibacter sp.]MBR4447022.1 hypothetical protein [Methanobrevibacter sp.]